MELLRPKRDDEGTARVQAPKARPADELEERHAFLCRACETEISDSRALFSMRASSAVQVFPNPYGQMRTIITLTEARSVIVTGAPTTEFTWFDGYCWQVVYCGDCRAHLGWFFETGEGEPKSFFGLLREALTER